MTQLQLSAASGAPLSGGLRCDFQCFAHSAEADLFSDGVWKCIAFSEVLSHASVLRVCEELDEGRLRLAGKPVTQWPHQGLYGVHYFAGLIACTYMVQD